MKTLKTLTTTAVLAFLMAAHAAFAAPVKITDVFANTSWREKKLIVETEFESKDAAERDVVLKVSVKDAAGKEVKSLKKTFKVGKGLTVVKPEIPWADPVTWELGRGYMYTLEAVAESGDGKFEYPKFRFGFRELWRDGKEIYMNGHIQRFRPCYHHHSNTNGVEFLHGIGYNTIHLSHRIERDPVLDTDYLYNLAEKGIAVMAPTACISRGRGGSNAELLKKNLRRHRNIPSCVAYYFGVNHQLPWWDKDPRFLAQGYVGWFDHLYKPAKENNPTALFFSHADGSCCDLATSNLYLNFTPLQEREDWLLCWNRSSTTNTMPYQVCEMGMPHQWAWLKPGFPAYTEYYAIYFGDDVYSEEAEPTRLLRVGLGGIERVRSPYYWKFHDMWTWRTARAWRTYGLNGGIVPFNLDDAYGMPGVDWRTVNYFSKYSPMYRFKERYEGRPDWAWPSYDYYRRGNLDFLGYIAGSPMHTDKRHAYWSGEKVVKQAVFLWDYFEPRTFTAKWKAVADGKTLASGKITQKCELGPIHLKEFSFAAPEVSVKTPVKITLDYTDQDGKDVFSDSFDIEVYPSYAREWAEAKTCYLVDPDGKSKAMLEALGVPGIKTVKSCAEIPSDATHAVIGRFALSKMPFEISPEAVEKGLKILVLPQMPKALQRMGFTVEDTMSRTMFPRDTVSPAYKDVTRDMLHDWTGQVVYGDEKWDEFSFGKICSNGERWHQRWTREMVVSGVPIRMPTTVGFIPVIDGEFDMNYAGLMTFYAKKGCITFCQLDFEDRVRTDPAATTVADAVIAKDFLGGKVGDHSRKVCAGGKEAEELLVRLRQPFTPLKKASEIPPDSVCVISPEFDISMSEARDAARAGARVVFYCHSRMAKSFGLGSEQKYDVYKVRHDVKNPLLRGVGAANCRWRDFFDYPAYVPGKGWRTDMDGMLAYGKFGNGLVVFAQFDPTFFRRHKFGWENPDSPLLPAVQYDFAEITRSYTNRFASVKDAPPGGLPGSTLDAMFWGRDGVNKWSKEKVKPEKVDDRGWTAAEASVERLHQLWARLLTNLGADPGTDALRRMCWAKDVKELLEPLPRPHVLGRLPVGVEDEEDWRNLRAEFMKELPTEKDTFAGKVTADGTEVTAPNGSKAAWDSTKMECWADGTACLWKTMYGGKWKGWSVDLLLYEFDVPEGEGRRVKFYTKCPLIRISVNGKEMGKEPMTAPEFDRRLELRPGRNYIAIKALSHALNDRDLVRISCQTLDEKGSPIVPPLRSGDLGFKGVPRPYVLSAYNVGTETMNDNADGKKLFSLKIPGEDEVFAGTVDFGKSVKMPDGKEVAWDHKDMEYRKDGTACIWKTPVAQKWKGWSLVLLSYELDVRNGESALCRIYSKSPAMRVSLNGTDLPEATEASPADEPNMTLRLPVKPGKNRLVIKAATHAFKDRDLIRVSVCRADGKGRAFNQTYVSDELVRDLPEEEAAKLYVPPAGSGAVDKVFYGPFRTFDAYNVHQY